MKQPDNMKSNPIYPLVPIISLELTNKCNLKCPYCGNRNLTRKRGNIDWELLEKLVDECKGGRHNIAWLHGSGEPLLDPRLEEAVRLIKGHNAGEASFSTNGTLLNRERIKKLLDAGLSSLYVSLDSLDPVVYKKTRGADVSKVIDNIKEVLQTVPSTFTVNIALMQSKLQALSKKDFDEFNRFFGSYKNIKMNRVENTIFPVSGEDYRSNPKLMKYCRMPLNYITIVHDGRASVCCVDQDVQCCLGDLRTETIKQIWYKPDNQDKFLKLSIGEKGCPEYCEKKCSLIADDLDMLPESERKIRRIDRLFAQAISFFKLKQLAIAASFLKKILEIDPDHAEALNTIGAIAIENKDYAGALIFFKKAILNDAKKPNYFFHCGLAFEALGNTGGAIYSYERTLAMNPGFKQAYDRLILILQKREHLPTSRHPGL